MANPSPRILIVRLSAIGDVLHALPVLNALRDALPNAFIAWVVEGRAADLLRGHQALNELVELRRGWLKSPPTVWKLRKRLRRGRFDITVDVQGLTKSAIAAWLSPAPQRIGFDGPDGRELSRWLNNCLVQPTAAHVIDRNLELLRALNITAASVRFDLPEAQADAAAAEAAIAASALQSGFAVINPGAGWPSKLWPADRYAAVARHLGSTRRLPSMVAWAGNQERQWALQIVDGSAGHARLAPATTLTQLAALLRRARLFIGSDTGPLHLAVAVGAPSVGLFGPMPAERNGPYGPQHLAVQKICLSGSSRQRRGAGPESMEAIEASAVIEACESILERPLPATRCA